MQLSEATIASSNLVELCNWYAFGREYQQADVQSQAETELRRRKALSNKDWSDVKAQTIRTGQKEHVAVCAWGPYKTANVSDGNYGRTVQFIFGDFGPYGYSDNGRITSWQSKL
jgi:hypothetical protein